MEIKLRYLRTKRLFGYRTKKKLKLTLKWEQIN